MSDLLPANVTLLQPGSRYFMLQQALQTLDIANQVNSQITALQLDVSALQSEVATLQSQVATLQGQVAAQQLFMNSFNWVQAEVSTGLTFLDGRNIYTRSFVISGALNTANNVFTFAHGIANINYMVDVIAMADINGGQGLPITFLNIATSPNITIGVSCWTDTANIYISVGATIFTNYLTLVKLYYTCTDR